MAFLGNAGASTRDRCFNSQRECSTEWINTRHTITFRGKPIEAAVTFERASDFGYDPSMVCQYSSNQINNM
ncbi:hypothetical protein KY284_019338 [Solanum tuberosum]|nr:hypothetical protein KY284_019338 [Solanum tuberosum]